MSSLKKNRILVTNESYRQIFSAYLSGKRPVFITSDSLLNAYHVLYEGTVERLESSMARRLPLVLEILLKNVESADKDLKGKPDLVSAAKRRAKLVVGVARRLIDDEFRFSDIAMDEIVESEVKKIVEAKAVEKSAWLGKPSPAFMKLDYSRYKPQGFYTGSEQLVRYFRAVSWLQSIPFRVQDDEELLAMLMLGNSVTSSRFDDHSKLRKVYAFFRRYKSLIGAGDDWDVMTAAYHAQNDLNLDLNSDGLQRVRKSLSEKIEREGGGSSINDQIRFAPDSEEGAAEANFRVVSSSRIPSGILFQATTNSNSFQRSYPSGLEVVTALGSSFGRQWLKAREGEDLLKTIDSQGPYFRGNSLYFQYLDVLRTLLDEPEKDAPDFLKSQAWQRKNCNAALSGWAQLRHTWALQAKQTAHWMGMTLIPPGFVEPEPDFFSKMADLAETSRSLLESGGAFEPDYDYMLLGLCELRKLLEDVKSRDKVPGLFFEIRYRGKIELELAYELLEHHSEGFSDDSEEFVAEYKVKVDEIIEDFRQGRMDKYPMSSVILEERGVNFRNLWRKLEKVSRRLEALSHKQLRGGEMSESDSKFIKGYGKAIADLMFYQGNSYLTAKDDAPRVVSVFSNPQEGGHLNVGVARARKLYVLYPWQDQEVLCVGAVLPYYEFESSERLDDAMWKMRLDSGKRPRIPEWMTPIVGEAGISKPAGKEEE